LAGQYAPDLVENFIRERADLFGPLGQALLKEDLSKVGRPSAPPLMPIEEGNEEGSESPLEEAPEVDLS
jgi:hypothetical protein